MNKLEEERFKKKPDTQCHPQTGHGFRHAPPATVLRMLKNEEDVIFLINAFKTLLRREGKRNSKKVAFWKKEMKVVKCNTRKVLLTRNRSLIPPASRLQLPSAFLKIHFSS